MPLLKKTKWEIFAQEIVKGATPGKAYLAAGYKGNDDQATSNGHRLIGREEVRARIDELASIRLMIEQQAVAGAATHAVEELSLTKAWVLEMLMENANRAMQKVPVLNEEGDATGEYRYNGAVANKALELLGKTMGLFPSVVTGKDDAALFPPGTTSADMLKTIWEDMRRLGMPVDQVGLGVDFKADPKGNGNGTTSH